MFAHRSSTSKDQTEKGTFQINFDFVDWISIEEAPPERHDESLILLTIHQSSMFTSYGNLAPQRKRNNSQPIIKAFYGTVETF